MSEEIVYRIDTAGRLAYVNLAWNAFAAANDAPELLSASIIGLPLEHFIAGSEMRQIMHVLVQRARAAGQSIDVPFRCDGPGERRQLQLTVTPLADGSVEFRTRPERLEGRGAARLLDRRVPRSGELLTMCSWCNRIRIGQGWDEVEVAVGRLGLFDTQTLPAITHGICGDCVDRVMGR